MNKQTKSKTAGKATTAKNDKMVLDATNAKGLCVLPISHIQEIVNWLNSDCQLMPQNELRRCIKLLNEAKSLDFEPE